MLVEQHHNMDQLNNQDELEHSYTHELRARLIAEEQCEQVNQLPCVQADI